MSIDVYPKISKDRQAHLFFQIKPAGIVGVGVGSSSSPWQIGASVFQYLHSSAASIGLGLRMYSIRGLEWVLSWKRGDAVIRIPILISRGVNLNYTNILQMTYLSMVSFFIQEGIAPAIIEEMTKRSAAMTIGDPMSEDVQMGAIISKAHQQRILDYIQIGIDEGAHLATGGKAVHPQGFEQGYFIEPTIMTNCHDDMRIVREEIFGPVMSVLTFKTEDEAIKRANDTDFGLGAGLITSDLSRAHRVAHALHAGNIWINSYNLIPPDWPFGGVKQSGFGRESSAYAIEAYTEVKATYIQL